MMTGRRSFTLGLVTAMAVALPIAASAHAPADYMDATWDVFPLRTPGTAPVVGYTRAPSMDPDAAVVLDAAASPWTDVGARFGFADEGSDALEPGDDPCNPTTTAPIGRGPIDEDGGILAVTVLCALGGQATYFEIVYDEFEPWWFGPSEDVPNGLFDFLSVMTHEFGHATGFGQHFIPERDPECEPFRDHHTMCAAIGPGNPLPRTLEQHDVHTFAGAYR